MRQVNNIMAEPGGQLPQLNSAFQKDQHHNPQKTLPRSRPGAYIEASLKRLETGLHANGKLTIDGGYGDYRMSIFRLKDKKKRMNELPTIFTRSFVDEANAMAPGEAKQLKQIVEAPNQSYLQQKMGKQAQKEGVKKLRWNGEEQEQLICQYLPKYQQERWFSNTIEDYRPVNKKSPDYRPVNKKSPDYRPVNKKPPERRQLTPRVLRPSRRPVKATHIFRFLDLKQSRPPQPKLSK